jgi:hypothetical protein
MDKSVAGKRQAWQLDAYLFAAAHVRRIVAPPDNDGQSRIPGSLQINKSRLSIHSIILQFNNRHL